jgi:hypothetical protein
MSHTNGQPPGTFTSEAITAIRREAIAQAAKWAIAGAVALIVAALLGWWLYLQPKIVNIVGGLPVGAVVAFDRSEGCPQGDTWIPFSAAAGRTVIGASNTEQDIIGKDDRGDMIRPRTLLTHGGSQYSSLTKDNLPQFDVRINYTTTNEVGDKPAAVMRNLSDAGNVPYSVKAGGTAAEFSNEMPYVALFYCKKVR